MQQQTALLSPRDIAWHQHWGLILSSCIKKHEEAAQFAASHRRKYALDNVSTATRLLEPKAFPLMLKQTIFNEDGSVKEIQESVWNSASRSNPLADEVRVRAAKKQAAARAVVRVESRDDRQDAIMDPVTGLYIELGRTNREARPNSAVQGVRLVNFEHGATYAGGGKAVQEAQQQKREYDAMPPAQAEKSKAEKIAELERKIAELVGQLQK